MSGIFGVALDTEETCILLTTIQGKILVLCEYFWNNMISSIHDLHPTQASVQDIVARHLDDQPNVAPVHPIIHLILLAHNQRLQTVSLILHM